MNKFLPSLLFFLSAFVLQSNAQNFIGVNFNYMQPLDEYSDNLEVHPKGLGLNYMFSPKVIKKFYLGAQIGVSMYATDSYMKSVPKNNIDMIDIEIEEEDCFFTYKLVGRYYFVENKLINPYLEANIGGLSFFSTKMTEEDYDEYFENSTTFHGTSLQTGIGGGLSYHLIDNLWIDLNVIYNRGSKADYRNIASSDIAYRVDPSLGKFESYTDNVNYSIGVQFGF